MRRFSRSYDVYSMDQLNSRAREMRLSPTTTEARMWALLRRRMHGVKFRRQVILGPFIVDFFCPELGLIIEVDGLIHEKQVDSDAARDRFMLACGYEVLRISSDAVSNDITRVSTLVAATILRLRG